MNHGHLLLSKEKGLANLYSDNVLVVVIIVAFDSENPQKVKKSEPDDKTTSLGHQSEDRDDKLRDWVLWWGVSIAVEVGERAAYYLERITSCIEVQRENLNSIWRHLKGSSSHSCCPFIINSPAVWEWRWVVYHPCLLAGNCKCI